MKTLKITFLFVFTVCVAACAMGQGVVVQGAIVGYSNGEDVTITYETQGITGTVTATIDANGDYIALLPVDAAYPGTMETCADICSFGEDCTWNEWGANQLLVEDTLYTCTGEAVVFYGQSTSMEYPQTVSAIELGGDGSTMYMYVQDDGHFSGTLWVAPVVAGGAALEWVDCNQQVHHDTVYWEEPATQFNLAINGCPGLLYATTITISGVMENMTTAIDMYFTGAGFMGIPIYLDDQLEGDYAFVLQNMPEEGEGELCFTDCTGTEQCTTVSWSVGNTEIVQNFDYCPGNNPASCSAEFTVVADSLYDEPYTIYLELPDSYAISYYWDFGTGETSDEQFPVIIYPWEGAYQICLNVQCPDGTYPTYCAEITMNSDGSFEGPGMALQPFTVIVVADFVGVNEIDSSISEISIYPNPVNDVAQISWSSDKAITGALNIYDATGRKVMGQKAISVPGSNTLQIATSDLTSGYYMIRFENEDGTSVACAFVK